MAQQKHFHLDRIKRYLDGVFALEPYIKTYRACAEDIYKVFAGTQWLTIREVESWLRGLKINVDYMSDETSKLARQFAVDINSLTKGKPRTESDVYWWALATAIWIFGGMDNLNPEFQGKS